MANLSSQKTTATIALIIKAIKILRTMAISIRIHNLIHSTKIHNSKNSIAALLRRIKNLHKFLLEKIIFQATAILFATLATSLAIQAMFVLRILKITQPHKLPLERHGLKIPILSKIIKIKIQTKFKYHTKELKSKNNSNLVSIHVMAVVKKVKCHF